MPQRLTKEKFIEKARNIHGDLYLYDKVEYINSGQKVVIICREHEDFLQTPDYYINFFLKPGYIMVYNI